MVLSSSLRSNSTINGGQICFGTIDYLRHLPTFLLAFDRGIDLAIGGFSFRVGSQGSFLLSYPNYSALLARKSASATTLMSFVASSSEVNSPFNINNKPAERGGDFANLFNEILNDHKIEGALDLPLQDDGSMNNIDFDSVSNFESIADEGDFANLYDGVSYDSEDE
jgi:hypothetical protein